MELVCKTNDFRFDSGNALLEDSMKQGTITKIYGKYKAEYVKPDRKYGRHWVTILEGPDIGRTITVPADRLDK